MATGRLLLGQPAKIGRMAVLAQHRRRGQWIRRLSPPPSPGTAGKPGSVVH
ncbi:MAG: hypothetical protein IMX01_07445 [Limnochordaceae bacterium]|nr:hypothetical protein [Limnochordaceae bacterium]